MDEEELELTEELTEGEQAALNYLLPEALWENRLEMNGEKE